MTEPVKRRYDTSRRQEQARENRRRILAAASGLFREKGYAATAMPEVAKTAGVAVQTVYKAFANKATLLKAVFDVTVAGDDEDVPIAGRDFIAAIQVEPSPARKIEMYLTHLAGIAPVVVPVQLLARDAAAADPAAAEVWAQMRAEMLTAMTYFAADLVATGLVRAGLTADDVRDVLWTYHGPEQYELLCLERGWSPERYGRFLRDAIIAAVLA
ncbi:TetR/AcrR family transcriptional regulator [Amycolatopsis sp. OK19-0408]|uniref:TetR/AcrR family transcriptional regulator n=1 Tax=Amycolatopsis iheyensis TaxID=2945988 RepID=A0A9X2NDG3_9PSEU|nr:TetR/AcrR family transcriptional regulator [Amycolatopsis iheyensis]MCR6484684.1 TetR/AcrR family transcriptional regulator [Amycolatopsis iheyensis]